MTRADHTHAHCCHGVTSPHARMPAAVGGGAQVAQRGMRARESEGCGVGARQGPDDSERVRVCVCACVHLCVCACVRVCERAPATCEAFAPSVSKYPA